MSTNLYLQAAQMFPATAVQTQSQPSVSSSDKAAASTAALPAQKRNGKGQFS